MFETTNNIEEGDFVIETLHIGPQGGGAHMDFHLFIQTDKDGAKSLEELIRDAVRREMKEKYTH